LHPHNHLIQWDTLIDIPPLFAFFHIQIPSSDFSVSRPASTFPFDLNTQLRASFLLNFTMASTLSFTHLLAVGILLFAAVFHHVSALSAEYCSDLNTAQTPASKPHPKPPPKE
jgi:hypothetical protein